MTACGPVSITPRQGSIFPRITGLDTVKKWQRTFFYVKSAAGHDALNLPEFKIEPPTAELNFTYNPAETIAELQTVHSTLEGFLKSGLTSDDLIRTFISRRICPLQRRDHKICHMRGALDPTRISKYELNKASVRRRVNAIAATEMTSDKWRWGVKPFYREDLPPPVSSPLSESNYLSSK